MRKTLGAVLVSLCACLLTTADTHAQSTFYLRLLPEVAVTSVMHTKTVTSGAGSSSSESSTTRPEGGINFYLGYLAPPGAGWVIGGEFRGTIALREDIDGVTPTGGSGTHAVWPGPWEFTNRVGLGANLILGRQLGSMNSRAYLFGGLARWNSDFRSAGADPASEESIEDQRVTARWPLTGGIGFTLPFERPLDIRLRYYRSETGWSASHDIDGQVLEFDYSFAVQGLALSVGLGTR